MSIASIALVIDDHPLVGHGIAAFLASRCGFSQAHSVTRAADFWDRVERDGPPSLVVVDFWLPEGASSPLLRELKTRFPLLPLLVISADDDAVLQEKVRLSGANGFLHKQETPEIFARAVAALLNGEPWFHSPEQRTSPALPPRELPVTAEELGLTPRQGQVLSMMLKGMPNKRIAQALSLTEQTVKEHVSGILERLGVSNRVEAISRLRGRRLE